MEISNDGNAPAKDIIMEGSIPAKLVLTKTEISRGIVDVFDSVIRISLGELQPGENVVAKLTVRLKGDQIKQTSETVQWCVQIKSTSVNKAGKHCLSLELPAFSVPVLEFKRPTPPVLAMTTTPSPTPLPTPVPAGGGTGSLPSSGIPVWPAWVLLASGGILMKIGYSLAKKEKPDGE